MQHLQALSWPPVFHTIHPRIIFPAISAPTMDSLGIDDAYAADIGKLTLAQLREEPKRLAATRAAINDKVQALSLENYRVHIDNHNCGKTVRDEVSRHYYRCLFFGSCSPPWIEPLVATSGFWQRLSPASRQANNSMSSVNASF
jgi:hypothetical protein